MGSPVSEKKRGGDELQHQVTITRGFWMGETAVTQGQWRTLMGSSPSYFKGDDELPVESVSWFDAVAFANSLSREVGAPECYELVAAKKLLGIQTSPPKVGLRGLALGGLRLPSEAEWEYAARAGTTTPFWTGANLSTGQANYDGNYPYAGNPKGEYRKKAVAVRSFPANPWGLLHPTHWEWCWDWYGGYPGGSLIDPVGPATGALRVVRGGGCWISGARACRSARRNWGDPGYRHSLLGLRLVRTGD